MQFKLLKPSFDKEKPLTAVQTVKLKEGKRLAIKIIQERLKESFNLKTELKESQIYLSLEAELPEIKFNREMLEALENIFSELDVLAIVPNFNDVYDNIQGVRFFMGINLN